MTLFRRQHVDLLQVEHHATVAIGTVGLYGHVSTCSAFLMLMSIRFYCCRKLSTTSTLSAKKSLTYSTSLSQLPRLTTSTLTHFP